MRKLFIILCLILLSSNAYALGAGIVGAVGGSSATVLPSCTGDTLFIWGCTSTTVTDDGCSVGDTSASAVSDPAISSGECTFGNGDYYTFAVSSEDIMKEAAGTIFVRFKATSALVNTATLLDAIGQTNEDRIKLYFTATGLSFMYEGANDGGQVATVVGSVNADTYYIARARWRTGDTDPPIDLSIYSTNCSALVIADTNNTTNITEMDTAMSGEALRIGNDTAIEATVVIDYVHIYGVWQDTDPNGDCSTIP